MRIKKEIQDLVKEAYLEDAIGLFLAEANSAQLTKDLSLLSSRLSVLKQKERKGTIYPVDANIERAKITESILSLLDEWQPDKTEDDLTKILAKIQIQNPHLGMLQLVNCNRKEPINRFYNAFQEKSDKKQKSQFYFIGACPYEMPSSFAERIVYEIIENESDSFQKGVYFQQKEGDFNRVKIDAIQFNGNLHLSQRQWKSYMQKWLKFDNTQTLEQFIQIGSAKLPYDYVFGVFNVSEDKWAGSEKDLFAYFQWLIDAFQQLHTDAPTFVFFFSIDLKEYPFCHKAPQENMFQAIKTFCEKNNQTLITDLKHVKYLHVEGWFKDDIGIYNPNDYEQIIDTLHQQKGLKEGNEKCFCMKDVEPLQEKVVKILRK